MNCRQCGTDNPPDAKFCAHCGAPQAAPPPVSVPPVSVPPPPQQPAQTEVVSQRLKVGIAIASVFLAVLGIVMGIIYLNDPNPSKKAAGKLWLTIGIASAALGCLCTVLVQSGAFQ